jgi:5-hydroxyisourate hydrolase-like protein (transthyretin family)
VRWALLFLVGCGLLACDDAEVQPPSPNGSTGCAVSGDCPTGLECRESACVGGSIPEVSYTLRFTPRSDSVLAPVELAGVRFEQDLVHRIGPIRLADRFALTGRARIDGRDIGVRVTARPLVRGALARRPLTFISQDADSSGNARFTLNWAKQWPTLSGGQQPVFYEMRMAPHEVELYPPWVGQEQPGETGGGLLTEELPLPADMPTLEGEILLREDAPNPLRNMQVFAVDAAGQLVSSRVTTDESGKFTLALWPADAPRAVTVRARSTDATGPLPDLEGAAEVPGQRGEPTELVRLFAGVNEPTFTLTGHVNDEGTPLSNVALRFRATVGNGTYRASAQTDAEGRFEAEVYPGEYVIDVVPPLTESRARLTRLARTLTPDSVLELSPKARPFLAGTVRDPAGAPVAEARITARLLRATYADPTLAVDSEEPPPRSVETSTDEGGVFSLQVDPGTHVLTIAPTPERGLPALDVEVQVPALGAGVTQEFSLPPAAALVVELTNRVGEPAAEVAVEAWAVSVEGEKMVAQGATDAAGRLSLILPNR